MRLTKSILTTATIVTIVLPLSTSFAAARPDTTRMTCNQVRNMVYSRGGIVLSTGRNTYDRFVSSRRFCPPGDYIERAHVRTRDRRSCPIGYTCTMDNPWEPWRD